MALALVCAGIPTAALAADPVAPRTTLKTIAAVSTCADLASVDLTDIGGGGSGITSAEEKVLDGNSICEVRGRLAPAIGFTVQLPTSTWTQRYLQIGCGGLCGRIDMHLGAADGCVPVSGGGFVVAATDMGHQGPDAVFGRDPQKRADFAYRGQHVTSLAARRLIKAYYGTKEAYAYFSGCSDGGREALMEALRYPDDFNGVIAGAPAMLFQFQNSMYHGWLAVSNTGEDGKPILLASRLPILHKAVVEACDGLDGLKDGLLSDPRLCHFDPGTLKCPAGSTDRSACLTAAEAEVAAKVYDGPRDPLTGARLTVGNTQYGSELAWAGVFVPQGADKPIFSTIIALGALRNLIFADDPPTDYTLKDFKFSTSTVELLKARHPLFDATNPDLSRFRAAGGKLILWHGWADQHISPLTTIAYHEAVLKQMGAEATAAFERLYLLPGVYHCGQGEGMSSIDLLTPMLDWVEAGVAPDAVIGSSAGAASSFGQPTEAKDAPQPGAMPPKAASAVVRSRPVYQYPALATFTGLGDPDNAANYTRGPAHHTAPPAPWVGEDFFKPYPPMD